MARRKLKKNVKIVFFTVIILSLFVVGYFIYKPGTVILNKDETKVEKSIDYKNEIIGYEIDGVTLEFLEYVDNNFESSLKNIYNSLEANGYSELIWRDVTGYSFIVLNDKFNGNNHTEIDDNTITFVGDTSFADNYKVMEAYNERGLGLEGVISSDVISYLNNSGLTIANSEFAFGSDETPLAGKYYTFVGDPGNVSLFHELGVDLVTLANNHVYDYGSNAFNTTLETFDNASIARIGAGKNYEEASASEYYIINGYKVSFINANRSEKIVLTPGATETEEGVFRCYDPENLINRIKEEDIVSDLVIPILHWGLEGSHEIEEVLLETGKEYIDAGADAIVGHHAHVLQGIEFYNNKPIVYNLGNFIFDDYSRELGVVTFTVNDDKNMDYLFLPALQEDVYTDFLEGEDKNTWINNMREWSINTHFEDDGTFYQLN